MPPLSLEKTRFLRETLVEENPKQSILGEEHLRRKSHSQLTLSEQNHTQF